MNRSKSISRRKIFQAASAIALSAAFVIPAVKAADYPSNKPVHLMVPYPAGGPSDVSARILSEPIAKALGARVVVENLGGATGTIAASKVLNADADGYYFFQGTQNELIIPPLTNKAIRFKPDEFESVQPITVTHLVLLVRNDLPAKNTKEFLDLAASQSASKPLTYGSVGVGSLYHLITDHMGKMLDIQFTHVPYKGTAPVVQDLASGQIDFSIMPFQASMLEMIKSGRYRAIAVLSKNKPPVLAHLPSITETPKLENFEYASNAGYFVKKGTPDDVKNKLNAAIGKALQDPEVIQKLEADGRNVAKPASLEQAKSFYDNEIAKYKEMIRVTGYVQTN